MKNNQISTVETLERLVKNANESLHRDGIRQAEKLFDIALMYAKENRLAANLGWTRYSSHNNYAVIKLDNPKIAYFPITKCACSTVKKWLMEINETRKRKPGTHQAIEISSGPHGYWGFNADFDLNAYINSFKFTILREPIKRFLSFYRHYHRNIATGLQTLNPELEPNFHDIDRFISYFCSNPKLNTYGHMHSLPQSRILGDAVSEVETFYSIEDLDTVRGMLEEQYKMAIPSLHQNKSDTDPLTLSSESIEQLKNYYAADYELLQSAYNAKKMTAKIKPYL